MKDNNTKPVVEPMMEYRKCVPSAKEDKPTKAPSQFVRRQTVELSEKQKTFRNVAKTAETDFGKLISEIS